MLLKQLVFAIGAITAGSLGSMTVSAETPLAGRNHGNFVTQDASFWRPGESDTQTFSPTPSEIGTFTASSTGDYSSAELELDKKTKNLVNLLLLSNVQPRRLPGMACNS